jgi:hypothetical protein
VSMELRRELFRRYEGNPILTVADWPSTANAVFNPDVARLDAGSSMRGSTPNTPIVCSHGRASGCSGRMPAVRDVFPTSLAGKTLRRVIRDQYLRA